uniref:Uncharacterized protein n=1 Tax=Leptospira santarosai serovar Arenal str. MAVJ 401 TaxID=1049976 RepID=M6JR92_9LEPT|nr:hypothetical protein LEP1GSC063_3348 [Leptospira santarosai serovar Arenal str. MAVJ 401]
MRAEYPKLDFEQYDNAVAAIPKNRNRRRQTPLILFDCSQHCLFESISPQTRMNHFEFVTKTKSVIFLKQSNHNFKKFIVRLGIESLTVLIVIFRGLEQVILSQN